MAATAVRTEAEELSRTSLHEPPASVGLRPPEPVLAIEPIADRVIGFGLRPEPEHVPIRIRHLALARVPGIVGRRMTKVGAATVELGVQLVDVGSTPR
jgi:hypothetical protein